MIDWKHYNCVGDWGFTLNPGACWADPAEMVATLKGLGVQQVFVSLHPWSEPGSVTFANMTRNSLCTAEPIRLFWANARASLQLYTRNPHAPGDVVRRSAHAYWLPDWCLRSDAVTV